VSWKTIKFRKIEKKLYFKKKNSSRNRRVMKRKMKLLINFKWISKTSILKVRTSFLKIVKIEFKGFFKMMP
jgi:hypothetical protein